MTTASKISLLNGLLLILTALSEFFGWVKFDLQPNMYQATKFLHLFGVAIFVGNMTVGPAWFYLAVQKKDLEFLKYANKTLQITDILFTIPGIALTVISGLFLASSYGGTPKQAWIFYAVFLLIFMYLLSVPLVILQEKIYQSAEKTPLDWEKVHKLALQWGLYGTIVMAAPFFIFYLMVFKPQLPMLF
jgi:uncharacterized membrane protein